MSAITAVMLPCDSMPKNIEHDVVGRLENQLRAGARETKFAFRFGLFFIEYLTPIFFLSWGRFSHVPVEEARRRFEKLMHHRISLFVLLAKLVKSLVQIALYSDKRVERLFKNHRRAWRENRFAHRNALIQISSARPRPQTPAPLVGPEDIDPETYLDWTEPKDPAS